MAEILYQTRLYSDDDVKKKYLSVIKNKDARAIDQGFVEYVSNKANLRVSRKCYMSVSVTCDKSITVRYSGHKKVEETTGYTVTKRTDAMGIDDYKVSPETKKVTYTDSGDYSKNFYGATNVFTECVDENFYFKGDSQGAIGYSKTMPDAYKGVKVWTGLSQKMRNDLTSSSGCSGEVWDCEKDVRDSAKRTGYTVDSCTLKSATASNVVVDRVDYYIEYFISIVYNGKDYSCKFGEHGEMLECSVSCPESVELKMAINTEINRAKRIKTKAKFVTVPTSVIAVAGIIMSFAIMFRFGFSTGGGIIIPSLVFDIWYWYWLLEKFKKVKQKITELTKHLEQRVFVDGVYIPEIMGTSLVVSSILLTFWNILVISANFFM